MAPPATARGSWSNASVLRPRQRRRPAARRDDRREPAPDRRPVPRSRSAGGRPPGLPRDLRRAVARGRPRGPRACRRRRARGRPRRPVGAEPVRVGRRPVRHGARRRDPRDDQPRLQGGRAAPRARTRPAVSLLVHARGFRGTRLRRAARRGARRTAARCARRSCSSDDWEAFLAEGDRVSGVELVDARVRPAPRRPDQHPVHLGDDRLPQGRDALAPQHRQQRVLRRPQRGLPTSTTASACRCPSITASAWCWAASPASPTAPASSCPGESFDAAAVLATVEAERCTSLYGVPTMFIAELAEPGFERYDLPSLRTGMMGGAPCPVEVMRRGALAHAHERGRDRLRHDRDRAAVDADGAGRSGRQARRDGRPRAPARRDQGRRPRDRRGRAARDARRAVHARLQRDARLLERPGRRRARRSTRTAGCTPATWR